MDLIMQKTGRFGSHFEFCHFTNLKHPLMQKITPDSDSTPNLAIEKLGFVYYFEKRFECAHPYYNNTTMGNTCPGINVAIFPHRSVAIRENFTIGDGIINAGFSADDDVQLF